MDRWPRRQPGAAPAARVRVRVEVEPRHGCVEPLGHRAIGVVIEAVHLGVEEASFLGPAVPALPDRRGTALHHRVEPGRELASQQKAVGEIEPPQPRQDGKQVGGAHEARRQMAVLLYVADERGARQLALVRLEQLEVQREHVARLRVPRDQPVGCHEAPPEGFARPRGQLPVALFLGPLDDASHVGEQLCRVGEECGSDQLLGGSSDPALVAERAVERHPIAKAAHRVDGRIRADAVRKALAQEVEVGGHPSKRSSSSRRSP